MLAKILCQKASSLKRRKEPLGTLSRNNIRKRMYPQCPKRNSSCSENVWSGYLCSERWTIVSPWATTSEALVGIEARQTRSFWRTKFQFFDEINLSTLLTQLIRWLYGLPCVYGLFGLAEDKASWFGIMAVNLESLRVTWLHLPSHAATCRHLASKRQRA